MRKELELLEFDDVWKLYDNLLGEVAELLGLPSSGVGSRV